MIKKSGILFCIVLCIMLIGCANSADQLEEQEIVFIYRELYYADSFINAGFFIDNEGKKYDFDLSDKRNEYELDEELYEYLLANKEELISEDYLEETELQEWYGYLCAIDSEAEIVQGMRSISGGGRIFLGVRLTQDKVPEIIMLESTGCWGEINTDESAMELSELFKKKVFE